MTTTQTSFVHQSCRPLLKWPGGKSSELPIITPQIPSHRRYFEPFFGGGSVFFNSIDVRSFANDLHPDLMTFYSCVKNENVEFFEHLDAFVDEWEWGSLEHREAMYYQARDMFNEALDSSAVRAARFFLIRQLAYGGMFRLNRDGKFNVPFGHAYARSDDLLRNKMQYLQSRAVIEKMQLLNLSELDFEDFLNDHELSESDFVFLDPPYDSRFSKYHDDFTEADQERLAQTLGRLPCKFMLVSKLTPLIENLYRANRYNVLEYEVGYRFNIKGRFSRSTTHVLVMNYGSNIGI